MPDRLFVDTNILVYAHDIDAGNKYQTAKQLIRELWHSDPLPTISVHVLQELAVSLRRRQAAAQDIREVIEDYSLWPTVDNTVDLLRRAISEMERWQVSFWDALILAAARSAGATLLWSEDLNEGQDYDGLRVVNPLIG